jgi:hypothetical protein
LGTYVGLKETVKPQIFESETEPTKQTYPQYDVTYGPFKSMEVAQKYVNAMGELVCSGA